MNAVIKGAAKKAYDNKKTILIVVAIIVSIIITIWIGKKIYKWVSSKIINAKLINESEEHTGTPITSTIQFSALVDRMFEAVYKAGTNEMEVYNVLAELRTQADWEMLKRLWQEKITSMPTITQVGLSLGGTKPTLIGTLYKELNNSELQNCRDILAGNGITPDF